MRPTICNWWKSCYHQRQLMQIIGLNIGGALSRLASQQETSQENWFNLLTSTKVLAKSWYRGRLFVYFTFHILFKIQVKRIKYEKCVGIAWGLNCYETHCTLCIHIWKFLGWKWNFLSWKNYWQALTVLGILAKNVWHGLPYPWPSYSCTMPRISDRMSCEESAIVFANLAYNPHIKDKIIQPIVT